MMTKDQGKPMYREGLSFWEGPNSISGRFKLIEVACLLLLIIQIIKSLV